jgi:hypothetical protein
MKIEKITSTLFLFLFGIPSLLMAQDQKTVDAKIKIVEANTTRLHQQWFASRASQMVKCGCLLMRILLIVLQTPKPSTVALITKKIRTGLGR